MEHETGITPQQCKMARGALNWSARQLAEAVGCSLTSVQRFEAGRVMIPLVRNGIRNALEAQGFEFRADGSVGGGPAK